MKNKTLRILLFASISSIFGRPLEAQIFPPDLPKEVRDTISDELLAPEEMLQRADFGKLNENPDAVITRALAGATPDAYKLYLYYKFQLEDEGTAMIWLTSAAERGDHCAQFCLARHFYRKGVDNKNKDSILALLAARYWADKSVADDPLSVDPKLPARIQTAINATKKRNDEKK